jgi:predicted small integral membrane protein
MSWMAWTLPTALFFIGIGLALIGMTVWSLLSPAPARRGFLPLETTRGDRFFISLLSAAFVHVIWLASTDANVLIASAMALLLAFVLMRWG